MKKILLMLLLAIVFYGCEMVEPKKTTASIKNNTTSEICIIEKYNENQVTSCDEGHKQILYYFEDESPFYYFDNTDTLNSIIIMFLDDEKSCYVFNDEGDYSVFNDIRLLSSYEYDGQQSVYEYTITEELKKASSPCTVQLVLAE